MTTPDTAADLAAAQQSLVGALDSLAWGAGISTLRNRVLPQPSPVPAIPARVGVAASLAR